MAVDDDTGVTLGEVNRNVTGMRTDLKDLTKDVGQLQITGAASEARVSRLEKLVYGALGASLTALVSSVLSARTN